MGYLVAAGLTQTGPAGTHTKTAPAASAPAGTPALTAASALTSTAASAAALTLTLSKTWHIATSFLRLVLMAAPGCYTSMEFSQTPWRLQ